ncbi:hypothetical protein ILUMI_20025 [Ignelater luminosus]|uniref:Uncharacterized protein n=1 Tax=Ignelater luminosus TaxID=2038154 RepID=A0A8K0CLD2_IGNLU|nr:hypothetical protein ILUMI_20025 [Ignelater luminosus]
MEKLKFEFAVKASPEDPKTNIMTVTSITSIKNEYFIIPEKFQPVKHHDKLVSTPVYQKVKSTLQRRGQIRKVWISLADDVLSIYTDEDGNMKFNGYLLEERLIEDIQGKQLTATITSIPEERKTKKLSEAFVTKKITANNSNVAQ